MIRRRQNSRFPSLGGRLAALLILLAEGGQAATNFVPIDPLLLRPAATNWEAAHQQRLTNLVFAQTWSIGSGNADTDDGKRAWPALLAEMWKVRGNSNAVMNFITNQGRTLINSRYAGQYYKPFSEPGHALYCFQFADRLPADQSNRVWRMLHLPNTNSTPCATASPLIETGWEQMRRADGHMDPIYCLTEFNSENFNWMARLIGPLWAGAFNDPAQVAFFGNYLSNWVRALFHAGRIEWNSNNYWGYTFQPLLVLYEFAPDAPTKARARAGLDWMLLEAALHYLDGFQAGPDARAKTGAHQPFAGSAWPYTYLYFIDGTNRPTYADAMAQAKMNRDLVGFAPWSSYRPPQVLLDIANRRFALPLEIHSAKPFYHLDHDNYADWRGDTSRGRRFEFETLWLDDHCLLASVATGRPDGAVGTFSEQNLWRLAVTGTTNGALQVFGNAGAFNTHNGRCPFEEIAQDRNVMLRAVKGTDRLWVGVPDARLVEFDGRTAFCDLGHGVYFALVPFNTTSHSSRDYANDTNCTQLVWSNGVSQLAALALEVGLRRDHGSYAGFKSNILARAAFTASAPDQVEYTATTGRKLRMQFMPTTTYTLVDSTVIHPAGVLPRVWREGVEEDFASWDCYEVVFGERIVGQRRGSGVLNLSTGRDSLRIAIDPVTALAHYAKPVVVPDTRLNYSATAEAVVLWWTDSANAELQQSATLPATNWSTIRLPAGTTSHTQAVNGAQSFFRLLFH